MRNKILTILFFLLVFLIYAQDNKRFQTLSGLLLSEFIEQLESEYGYQVFVLSADLPTIYIQVYEQDKSLTDILNRNLNISSFSAAEGSAKQIYIIEGAPLKKQLPDDFFTNNNPESAEIKGEIDKNKSDFLSVDREYITKNITIGNAKDGIRQKTLVLKGVVKNAENNEAIINGSVFIPELQKGTVTDNEGNYSFELERGIYTLRFSSLESMDVTYKVNLLSNGNLDVLLPTKAYQLEEVIVSTDGNNNVRGNQMGYESITAKKIKDIPVVLGERDLIKVALLLPGVQTVGEGSSGFNVRGSPVDQNIFYINKVPVYNPSHLFGFFSAFNSEAVSEFSLLKANIPASFGGRLASVFDITAKDGRKDKFSLKAGISPITGNIMVEGPLKREKSSYMVSLRSTYSDWILNRMSNLTLKNSSAYFGDAMTNFSFQLNPKNKLKIFGYYSYDDSDIAELTKNIYENKGGSIEWNRLVNNRHSFDLSVATAAYDFENENIEYDYAAYKQSFSLNHHELKSSFTYNPDNKHSFQLGINSIYYSTNQGDLTAGSDASLIRTRSYEKEQALESAIFLIDNWKINDQIEISAGLRYNLYNYLGPGTVYNYNDGLPRDIDFIQDTIKYGNLENIASYGGLDYRLGFKYVLNHNVSFKASYNRLHQYIFMLSNTTAVSPTDLWKLADSHIEPMRGDQVSAGVYSNMLGDILELSVETYYKKVNKLVEFKDGAELLLSETPETEIVQGNLDAWGIEVMLRKTFGDLNGWLNYTYSSANVLVNNTLTGEQNNLGYSYPANYDKPHAFNIVANYKVSKRLSFSGNVVYSTGRPISYPTAIYFMDGMEVTHYSFRNEYRLPDYFRVDLAMNIEGNLKRDKLFHGSLTFSVYNLTGRKNAYSVFFTSEEGKIKAYKMSIFGVPVFSVTYNIKLGNYAN